MALPISLVMAGLVPAIHDFIVAQRGKDVDGRDKPGHAGVPNCLHRLPRRSLLAEAHFRIPAAQCARGVQECSAPNS